MHILSCCLTSNGARGEKQRPKGFNLRKKRVRNHTSFVTQHSPVDGYHAKAFALSFCLICPRTSSDTEIARSITST